MANKKPSRQAQAEHDRINALQAYYEKGKLFLIGGAAVSVLLPWFTISTAVVLASFSAAFFLLELKWMRRHGEWHMRYGDEY